MNGRNLLVDISMTLVARERNGERSQGTSRGCCEAADGGVGDGELLRRAWEWKLTALDLRQQHQALGGEGLLSTYQTYQSGGQELGTTRKPDWP